MTPLGRLEGRNNYERSLLAARGRWKTNPEQDDGRSAVDKRARRARRRCKSVARGGTQSSCDSRRTELAKCDLSERMSRTIRWLLFALATSALVGSPSAQQAAIIVDHHHQQQQQQQQQQEQQAHKPLPGHFQPASLLLAQNRSMNFTHVLVDELTQSVYVGASNWLLQLSARDLKIEQAVRTGPAPGAEPGQQQLAPRDCPPADCHTQLAAVHDLDSLPLAQAHNVIDLSGASLWAGASGAGNSAKPRLFQAGTMHSGPMNSSFANQRRAPTQPQVPATTPSSAAQQAAPGGAPANNYNKILALDADSRQLIVCGSLNQGACRRHQLGNIANFSELIPLPVASNDEHSSSVALVTSAAAPSGSRQPRVGEPAKREPVIYVAATNSRLGPYREMVPAISARSLDFSARDRAMQIIERSFTDMARVDISFELRDYYLVNYVHAFQHQEFVYFATVQRKSPLRQLEEQGYTTRLARLCLNDLSFQSYTEMTLECVAGPAGARATATGSDRDSDSEQTNGGSSKAQTAGRLHYNLLQDAHLMQAGSQLQQQLGLGRHQSHWVLAGAFAQSRDHTTRSSQRSAICLFPMERIEARFQENIDLCLNGTTRSRNMNYIAGSVNDCPRQAASNSFGNYCNEPIKLNGSLALTSEPIAAYDSELLTSISATLAPTSPLNMQAGASGGQQQQRHSGSSRQHQVLLAGTAEGRLKRLVLVANSADQKIRAIEFDSLQVAEPAAPNSTADNSAAILAHMSLMPHLNPQLQWTSGGANSNNKWHQHALVASANKLVKVRVNSCGASGPAAGAHQPQAHQNGSTVDECLACAQVQDPFCGWCASSASCTARHECLAGGLASGAAAIHWTPFDSIRCSNYQPISPKNVPLQADATGQQPDVIDVNVRTNAQAARHTQLNQKLAQAQFSCHFDFLSHWNKSAPGSEPLPRPSGATTKASQPRLNLQAGTVAIGCPLPVQTQRPRLSGGADQLRVRLTVRLSSMRDSAEPEDRALVERALGLRSGGASLRSQAEQQAEQAPSESLERELTLYDCSAHSSCQSCLTAGSQGRRWACSWCPLGNRCTHNASHADFGCAASALASTTPHSNIAQVDAIRGSHLTASLDRAQASMLAFTIDKLRQCPRAAAEQQPESMTSQAGAQGATPQRAATVSDQPAAPTARSPGQAEILVPSGARRSVQVALQRPIGHFQREKRVIKLECLLELEGEDARFSARFPARLADQQSVACHETQFSYQAEVATQRAALSVILNDNQVIETSEVILYKCHLFGVNPPALTSSVAAATPSQPAAPHAAQHSSASWPPTASEFLSLMQASAINQQSGELLAGSAPPNRPKQSDCSLCLNVERKYQCNWCSNQCRHSDQCHELAASACPAPRIDLIHPNSGPLDGGTLLTIEGSNLGSNEREIQDKILVGGEQCQLVMYSVSTRIVCKTAPSLAGPQAATVFVGNRAGVTSAREKFHYKTVHLNDVNPRIGPVSGGTRLFLSGSNLNVGSRVQIFLDDIPCPLDSNHEPTSNQLVCITAPNLLLDSMRISRLTLLLDNSTHQLPYPFTYQPDPIITQIEPAESFLSGGRLILISGQHLASPQTTKLMVFHESRPSISNVTSCMKQNDTLVTCLTPAFSRDLLLGSTQDHQQEPAQGQQQQQQQQLAPLTPATSSLSYHSDGLRLKMMLLMDDVKSVRNLDEYYHHLPHYITYFEDPRLFKLPSEPVEFRDELVIAGEQLQMRQLDQDMLITVGAHVCPVKSILADRVICEPPQRIAPVLDERRRLVERPVLPIVGLIGSNLRYELGSIQYSSSQYAPLDGATGHQDQPQDQSMPSANNYNALFGLAPSSHSQQQPQPNQQPGQSGNKLAWILQGLLMFVLVLVLFVLTFISALLRRRHTKAKQREYKRIQLQMGSLDINGQPMTAAAFASGDLFDKIHHSVGPPASYLQQTLTRQHQQRDKAKPFYQFFSAAQQHRHQAAFAPSPPTDISSLVGSSPAHQQHLVKLNASGLIVNKLGQTQYNYAPAHSQTVGSGASSSSPAGSSSSRQLLPSSAANQVQHYAVGQLIGGELERANLLVQQPQALQRAQANTSSSRNFNWTQEAPSTIVPYAVIEACNLTLEGKNAIKDYV